jgi:hypothetical protein
MLNNHPNLEQGIQFLQHEKNTLETILPNLNLIEQTSSPKFSSIIEAMNDKDSIKSKNDTQKEEVSKLEKLFNATLAEYTATYKLINEELMLNAALHKEQEKYFGSIVTNNTNYIYINDYGFTHKFEDDSIKKLAPNCPKDFKTVDFEKDGINKLSASQPMGMGQACKIAGKNIMNKETKEVAWVDIKGIKHIYSQDIWKEKSKTCDLKPIQFDNDMYVNIPSGPPMSKITICNRLNVEPKLWKKLHELNAELLKLSKLMLLEISKLEVRDSKLNKDITQQKEKLEKYINNFNNNKNSINNLENGQNDFTGNRDDARIRLNMESSRYYTWLMLALIVGAIIFYTYSGFGESRVIQIFLLIVAIVALYYIFIYLRRHYF